MQNLKALLGTGLVSITLATVAVAQTTPPPTAADSAFLARNWKRAAELYRIRLAATPTDLTAHVRAGFTALELGENKDAEQHFGAVIATAPANGAPVAHGGLAVALARGGALMKALAHIDSAVRVGWGRFDVMDNESAFRGVQKDPRFVEARRRAEANSYPCMSDSASRSFDFWLGDWDVYANGTTQHVGVNRIDRIAGGCALLENWVADVGPLNGPSDGKSMNYLDPVTNQWMQVWMGSGRGQTTYNGGRYYDGAMRFTYKQTNARGITSEGRFTFHNLGPNRVRQIQESTADGGKTFQTVYDFIYTRKNSGETPLVRDR